MAIKKYKFTDISCCLHVVSSHSFNAVQLWLHITRSARLEEINVLTVTIHAGPQRKNMSITLQGTTLSGKIHGNKLIWLTSKPCGQHSVKKKTAQKEKKT